MSAAFDPVRALRALVAHEVRFVVVGGFGAWIHGAPVMTADVDIVFDASTENTERLAAALRSLGAVYRDPLGRQIEPDAAGLASTGGGGHHLFTTDAGDLDTLRESGGARYDGLRVNAVEMEIEDLRIFVASLRDIIEMKTKAGRPKDLVALPVLRAALDDDG
ncbi:MAG: hypothetical protein RIT81_32625 [Deltaproteobacteria bacterium]